MTRLQYAGFTNRVNCNRLKAAIPTIDDSRKQRRLTPHVSRLTSHDGPRCFGSANADQLRDCYANKIGLSDGDLIFGQELWEAYKNGDLEKLTSLSRHQSLAFPYLQEVVKAHVDRFPKDGTKGRPEKVIEDITKNISTDFYEVFKEFWNRESIYGFGDTQLKSLYDKVMNQH